MVDHLDGAHKETFREKVERHGKQNEEGDWEEEEVKTTKISNNGDAPDIGKNLKTIMAAHGDTEAPEGCVSVTTNTKSKTKNGEKMTKQKITYTMADGSTSSNVKTASEKLAIKP